MEEKRLAELHGLDAEQIYWRRRKIAELRSEDLFKREYPPTPEEAFVASWRAIQNKTTNSYIIEVSI
jgi:hypothetical protein